MHHIHAWWVKHCIINVLNLQNIENSRKKNSFSFILGNDYSGEIFVLSLKAPLLFLFYLSQTKILGICPFGNLPGSTVNEENNKS